jgi:hypothetical protein
MEFAWFAETKKMWPSQRKEGMEREICTQLIYVTELRRRLADLREREREREERGKGAFAVGERFYRYHFFTNQNNRPYYMYADNPMQQR